MTIVHSAICVAMLLKSISYIAIGIFSVGLIYRMLRWIRPSREQQPPVELPVVPFQRKPAPGSIGRSAAVIKGLLFDVVLLTGLARVDRYAWAMHLLIFGGFMALFLMHGLEDYLSRKIFDGYSSTLNPFLFLRDFFGVVLLSGLIMALIRRIKSGIIRKVTRFSDTYAIGILTVIVLSGFLLHASKIISEPIFEEMTNDFLMPDTPQEADPLRRIWAEEFGIVFRDLSNSFPTEKIRAEQVEIGREMHEASCASCHSAPSSSFLSCLLSKAIAPIGDHLNGIRVDRWLLYMHFISCMMGLALLPFSKFLHIFSTPVSLIAKRLYGKRQSPGLLQKIEFDACTHCGLCTEHCSVAPIFKLMPNFDILPSERLRSINRMDRGLLSGEETGQLAEGGLICTNCHRCTDICPAGIDLQRHWFAADLKMHDKGYTHPAVRILELTASDWFHRLGDRRSGGLDRCRHPDLSGCIQCGTCTGVCPVVANHAVGDNSLDLTPQQVMNLVHLGLGDLALGSRMVWECTTCYACQERCPQGIEVADILLELRNEAYDRLKPWIKTLEN